MNSYFSSALGKVGKDPAVRRGRHERQSNKAVRYGILLLAVALLLLLLLAPGIAQQTVTAGGTGGPIAYVRADTGDEIRLIEPNGTSDRLLWSHGQPDPEEVYDVWSLDWRPDGTELAFASTHENWCSLYHSDVFVVGSDGSGYRRVTQAPSCAALTGYPQGTVQVPVENNSFFDDPVDLFIYFQGAAGVQQVSLPPGGSTVVTFENVADFGDEFLQVATMIEGDNREILFATAVDVEAGTTVTTGSAGVYSPSGFWEVRSPTWRRDGSKAGFILNFSSLMQIDPKPTPLTFGDDLLAGNVDMPDFAFHLAWGPTSTTANQLLYEGNEAFGPTAIYHVTEGSATAGEPLVIFDSQVPEDVRGLAWLPDGSGFLYTATEQGDLFVAESANIYEYNFATGQSTPVTEFDDFAGMLSVSPDGGQIVFERSAELDDAPIDLWLVNRDGTGAQLLVENGRAPAWSTSELQPPPTFDYRIHLPIVRLQ